jgi:hypothetical protein
MELGEGIDFVWSRAAESDVVGHGRERSVGLILPPFARGE